MNIPLLTLILIASYFTCGIQAAEWMVSNRNQAYPGYCAISDDLLIEEGKFIKDPNHACRQIVCGSNGLTVFQTCGSISGLPKGCQLDSYVNVELPYPQCCERNIICF